MQTLETMRAQALETLKNEDEIFVAVVDDLDSWNGYADGFRAWGMYELDDMHCGVSLSEFLERITDDFSFRDNYFYYSIYGLESTDDKTQLYRDNVDEDDLLDEIIDRAGDLDLTRIDADFAELIDEIEEAQAAA